MNGEKILFGKEAWRLRDEFVPVACCFRSQTYFPTLSNAQNALFHFRV